MLFGSFNINICDINAILVTHEHIDHVKSIATLSNKYNIPVYATSKTWNSMPLIYSKLSEDNIKKFTIDNEFNINSLKILPFSVPHDAAEPCGFNVFDGSKKISIATDLGHMNNSVFTYLKNSEFIFLESNYDQEVLKYSSYPYTLKQRISGTNGHLSNSLAGKTLSKLADFGLNNALLVHLSKENNFPELAYESVYQEIKNNNFSLFVAPRDNPSQLFKI